MNKLTASVRSSLEKSGHPTLSLFEWNQHYADAKIYRIGRLEFHFGDSFGGAVNIFENKSGEHVALADGLTVDESGYALGAYAHENKDNARAITVSEDESAYVGYPYDKKGYVASQPVRLEKSEWTKIITRESPALKLHIPADGKLTPESVDMSLRDGMEFAKKYFPDFDYRIFSCYSWLCDPQLAEILDGECNIVKFSNRFHPLSIPSKGRSVFNFVYRISDPGTDYALLPERTSLERALKKHYTDGKVIYEMRGYFFK